MGSIGCDPGGERADEHHPLQSNVDDSGAFAQQASQCGKNQGRGNTQGGRYEARQHALVPSTSPEDSFAGVADFRVPSQVHSPSAETESRMIPCSTKDSSRVTCSVSRSRSAVPLWSAPNNKAEGIIAKGLLRASKATAMPMKP